MENIMKDSDLVFYKGSDGETKSVGYKINNDLINNMLPAAAISGGGKGKKSFAIPAGLYLQHYRMRSNIRSNIRSNMVGGEKEGAAVIGRDLYDRLLDLAAPRSRSRRKKDTHKTRKKRKTSLRKTRRKL